MLRYTAPTAYALRYLSSNVIYNLYWYRQIVYLPLLIDNSNFYIVATKAFYVSRLPYKLLLELALKKYKKLYIRPNKETSSYTI